jgi:hypothetical protein
MQSLSFYIYQWDNGQNERKRRRKKYQQMMSRGQKDRKKGEF